MNILKSILIKIGIFLGLITIEEEKREIRSRTFSSMEEFCKEIFK